MLKVLTPKVLLAGSTVGWGAITIGTAFATNYGHLIACRVMLGVLGAGLFPCLTVYIMMTYARNEVGRRMAYLYTCVALSGAFGGLIAYGFIRIRTDTLVGWQFLYIVSVMPSDE